MGTDIHGVWQKRVDNNWVDIPSNYEQSRHYQLFAVLADVRNGYGFAGVRSGQAITPISEPRGLPNDFHVEDQEFYKTPIDSLSPEDQEFYLKCGCVKDGMVEISMGDHSHSWLSAAEMLEWFKTAPPVVYFGVISREQYETWDKKSAPSVYSVGISGPGIVTIEDRLAHKLSTPNWTHLPMAWEADLRTSLAYFFNEVQRLVDTHNTMDIRFVFGFDS